MVQGQTIIFMNCYVTIGIKLWKGPVSGSAPVLIIDQQTLFESSQSQEIPPRRHQKRF
jgi:hypothetical protein